MHVIALVWDSPNVELELDTLRQRFIAALINASDTDFLTISRSCVNLKCMLLRIFYYNPINQAVHIANEFVLMSVSTLTRPS